MRSVVTAGIFLALMNVQIKYYMYSSIERKHVPQLMMRVSIGLLMLVCIYTSVKYLPLVYVALSSNMGPLVTALFSCFFIKVPVQKIDIMVLIISFIGVALLITGAISGSTEITDASVIVPDVATTEPSVSVDQNASLVQSASLIIPIIAMLGLPIMGAAQSILLR
jgi:drug/metabolite transporter (DMT)-like permease